jgi:type IV secretion system protein TrbL
MNFSAIESAITQISGTLFNRALEIAAPVLEMGNGLLAFFALMIIVWKGIEFMLDEEKGSVIFDFLKMMMFIAVIKWLLDAYSWLTPELYKGFETIIRTITGGETPVTKTMENIWVAFDKIQILGNTLDKTAGYNIGYIVYNMILGFKLALIQLMGLLGVTFVVGAYLAMTMIVQILIAVGVILAPVLIPFFLLPYFSWIADGVIRYMIVTGMIGVVLSIVLYFAGVILSATMGGGMGRDGLGLLERMSPNEISSMSREQAVELANSLMISDVLAMFMLMALVAWTIMQAPTIAEMLLSGRGVGGATASGGRSAMNRTAQGINTIASRFKNKPSRNNGGGGGGGGSGGSGGSGGNKK